MKAILLTAIAIIAVVSIFTAIRKNETRIAEETSIKDTTRLQGFGYKNMWFAVRTTDNTKVAEVLGLKNRQTVGWSKGINTAYKDKVFITPPLNGWVLVVGLGLGFDGSSERLQDEKELADKLSAVFGEAQFFSTHRVVEYHCWLRSVNGKTERAYAYIGESGENIEVFGTPTPAEAGLNLVNTFSKEAQNDSYFEREDLVYPDEDLVMKIAGKWSVNPTLIEEDKNSNSVGILGILND